MNNTVSPEFLRFLAQANGTLEALVLAFGALAATHPQKEKVAALIAHMADNYAGELDHDTEYAKILKAEMKKAFSMLQAAIESAAVAEQRLASRAH